MWSNVRPHFKKVNPKDLLEFPWENLKEQKPKETAEDIEKSIQRWQERDKKGIKNEKSLIKK